MLNYMILIAQLLCSVTICAYFVSQMRSQRSSKSAIDKNAEREMEKLRRMRARSLTQPLSEKTRPACFDDIVGQRDGIKALLAALCSPNPQHVIIYGPPGIGKTCAARLVLDEAKKRRSSPFARDAKFIEIDATCVRFDERSIADPLIGSVHDPIYQGAGAMGVAGIPQPKPGAVTKANGGVLFLDEIGELHSIQMNKLLKVLEDRKVFFESAYYNPEDRSIPQHIHDIFTNGLPADFRLVGATTCQPSEIPPAIRSRCLEIFFRPLKSAELQEIAQRAVKKTDMAISQEAVQAVARYCDNGRDVVNMVQLCAGVAMDEERDEIVLSDVEWVAETCRYRVKPERKVAEQKQVGYANGLAVTPDGQGVMMEIEAISQPCGPDSLGTLTVTGIVEEEEIKTGTRKMRRRSTASASVQTVLTALRVCTGLDARHYDLHINFPGGVPVDGPSAGVAMAAAVYSALTGIPCDNELALTGEVSIRGEIKPVGGVRAKIEAAVQAGAMRVIIPQNNDRASFANLGAEILPANSLREVITAAFGEDFLLSHEQRTVYDDVGALEGYAAKQAASIARQE